MNFTTLLSQVKKGQLEQLYLLHGEETYLIRQLEQEIIKALLAPDELDMNLSVFEQSLSINELVESIETVPFMGGKNVILLRGTGLFSAKKAGGKEDGGEMDERLIKILGNIPEYSHVIFSTTEKVDKRRKVYKQVEKYGVAIELAHFKIKDAREWVVHRLSELGKSMTGDGMEYFLSIVSMMSQISLGFLNSELEKAALYAGDKPSITKDEIAATMAALPEVSVFAMVEAWSQKQTNKTIKLLEEQLSMGEHPLKIIALLSRQVRLMWRVKMLGGMGSRQIADELGLAPFIAEKTIRQAQGFSIERLKEALVALARADYDFKSGRSHCITLEKIILEMCQ